MEGFNSGDTVVVIGSGPLACCTPAHDDGAGQIIAMTRVRTGWPWARRCGADEARCVVHNGRGAC